MIKRNLLLVTTPEDRSLSLFFDLYIQEKFKIYVINYFEDLKDIIENILNSDIVYFRDPFNFPIDKINKNFLKSILNSAIKSNKHVVDNLEKVEDFYFEDKWFQYQLFKDYMPETELLSKLGKNIENVGKKYLIKKRFSSKSQGIFFNLEKVYFEDGKSDDYIVQQIVRDFKREYRVYLICGEIYKRVSVKSNKFYDKKVKIKEVVPITNELKDYISQFISKIKFDFVGLDILETLDGKFFLLEVNRSPLFTAFYKFSKKNLARELVDCLFRCI